MRAHVVVQGQAMIVLFTDFGLQGPYTGQMKAVLHQTEVVPFSGTEWRLG